MAKIILVRHGESVGNRDRVFGDDPQSLPLTPVGYAQARGAARLIAARFSPQAVISSPFLRARETARVVAEHLSLPVEIEDELYERDVGAHRGKSYDSLYRAPDYDASRHWVWRPEGGESYEDVRSRVGPVLDRLARTNQHREVVIVSHGGVMMTLWAHVSGHWRDAFAPPNCGIVVIEHDERGYAAPQIIQGEAAADTGG